MYSEEQWEYIGDCEGCGAALYRKDDKIKPSGPVPPGHYCWIDGNKEEEKKKWDSNH